MRTDSVRHLRSDHVMLLASAGGSHDPVRRRRARRYQSVLRQSDDVEALATRGARLGGVRIQSGSEAPRIPRHVQGRVERGGHGEAPHRANPRVGEVARRGPGRLLPLAGLQEAILVVGRQSHGRLCPPLLQPARCDHRSRVEPRDWSDPRHPGADRARRGRHARGPTRSGSARRPSRRFPNGTAR